MKRIIAAVIATAALASMTACGNFDKAQEPFKDSPIDNHQNQPATVIEMPDGFNNLATVCIGNTGIRVTSTFHGDSAYGSVAMVYDKTCPHQ